MGKFSNDWPAMIQKKSIDTIGEIRQANARRLCLLTAYIGAQKIEIAEQASSMVPLVKGSRPKGKNSSAI